MGAGCHNGCYKGDPIVAFQDGTVVHNGPTTGYGLAVYINHGQQSDGNYLQSRYGHFYEITVGGNGTEVKAGQVIGYMGNRGTIISSSHGTHLHFDTLQNSSELDTGTHNYIYHKNPMNWFPGY
jgi:murein DD-endopeptidase MepM/ murein hydrolase activator NlpD